MVRGQKRSYEKTGGGTFLRGKGGKDVSGTIRRGGAGRRGFWEKECGRRGTPVFR